jgi:hypothetical protein
VDRHAIAAVIGCATLSGFLADLAERGRPVIGVALLGVFLGCFVLREVYSKTAPLGVAPRAPVLSTQDAMYPNGGDLPIVVSNPLRFLQMFHYGSPEVTSRIVYLSDPKSASRIPDFIPELVLRGLQKWAPIKVEDYSRFVTSQRSFWVYYHSYQQAEWLVPQLVADGRKVELRAQDRDLLLFLVTAPSQGRTAPGP